jgi:hypothetical protein
MVESAVVEIDGESMVAAVHSPVIASVDTPAMVRRD